EQADGIVEVSLGGMEVAEIPADVSQVVRIIQRLREAHAVPDLHDAIAEPSLIGEYPNEIDAGNHGRNSRQAKPFATELTRRQSHDLDEQVLGASVVAR